MKIAIEELLSYPGLFDVFDASAAFPRDLAARGFHPPLPVLETAKGRFLVWGKTVLAAAGNAGLASVEATVYGPEELGKTEALLLALELEGRKDRYSWPELGRLVQAMKGLGLEDRNEKIAGLVSSEGGLKAAERWLGLPALLRDLVARGGIDLKTAEAASSLPAEPLAVLGPVLEGLSFSERRIFLKTLAEVLKRDRPDAETEARLVAGLLEAADPLESLCRLRYPELTDLEERFAGLAARHLRGSGVSLKPPPYFEGRRFSVAFDFESLPNLRKKLSALESLVEEEGDELFSLL